VNQPEVDSQYSGWSVYKRLLSYSIKYWPLLLVAAIGMLIEAGAAGAFTYLMKPMVDETFVARNAEVRWVLPLTIVGIFLLRGFATFAADIGMARAGRSVVRDIRRLLHRKMLRLSSARFDQETTASMVSRLNYDTEQVRAAATEAVKVIITDALTIVALLSVMLLSNWKVTLVILFLAPIITIISVKANSRYRRLNYSVQQNIGAMGASAEQSLAGQQEVKLAGTEKYEEERYFRISESASRLNLKIETTRSASSSIVQLVAAIALAVILFIAGHEASNDRMTAGDFVALMLAMLSLLPSLKRITTIQATLARGIAASERIFRMLDEQEEQDIGTYETPRAKGVLEFNKVSLRYANSDEFALKNVSFSAKPGTVTAIVGRSGGGKTSLVRMIPRYYELSDGEILLDGVRLQDYRLTNLRKQIAMVGQRMMLFDESVASNIAYGLDNNPDANAIRRAAEMANATEFIDRLPEGMNAKVGENGGLLSGGQRQRIAIARAVLKDAPLLILDEATSALDNESERLIRDALDHLIPNRTTIVIAHRLSTIEHADQILVMDQGSIVEQGTHKQLIEREGLYARLHRMQFRDAE
jgi:ATP-binding cassette, subfamily B, bacterial MsbA